MPHGVPVLMATRVVIEWTRSSVRLALARGQGDSFRVRMIRDQPIMAGDVSAALRELLRAARAQAAEVVAVVPREHVLTRVVKFPTVQPDELAQMAELYAKAQLPYPREQTVMDFSVVSQQEGFSTVAIIACQRDVVDRQLAVLHEAGLSVGWLTVSSWGVLGWYRRAVSRAVRRGQASEPPPEPCLVLNTDDTRTDLVLIGEGRILSSRSASQGLQDWSSAGDTAEILAAEVERSRAAIRKELPGTEVRSLLLTGLGTLQPWAEQLSQRLALPVDTIDPVESFRGAKVAATTTASPIVVGGLAGGGVEGVLDLSPPEMHARVRHRQQQRELIAVSALMMALLAVGGALLAVEVFRRRHMAAQLDMVLTQIQPMAKRTQEQLRASQLVGSILDDRRRLAVLLSGVFRATPADMTLEGLIFERTRHELVLRGHAASTQAVLEYLKLLEQVEGVSHVDLRYSTRRSTPAGERNDFEITLYQRAVAAPEHPVS